MVRVFIVDDSAFVRKALTRALSREPAIRVVGEAASGDEALASIPAVAPDLVTLDVEMPGRDGLATLRALLGWRPTLPVIMLSAHTRTGAEATLDALAIGAVDFIDKSSFNLMEVDRLASEVIAKITIWDQGSRERRAAPPPPAVFDTAPATPVIDASALELCVIGASTGGPAALQTILEGLPAEFPLALAVVQHMPVGFTRPFAERLNAICRIQVREASDGDPLVPGTGLIAPAGQHLRIGSRLTARLSHDSAGSDHVPSVDMLMTSAARARPGRVLGVLLTGMGQDGAEGMTTIRQQRGVTMAQNEETCAVYGMPRAAVLRGGVDHLLSLQEIAATLAGLKMGRETARLDPP
jgi:two-component system chemotaxis response regulator CheB